MIKNNRISFEDGALKTKNKLCSINGILNEMVNYHQRMFPLEVIS